MFGHGDGTAVLVTYVGALLERRGRVLQNMATAKPVPKNIHRIGNISKKLMNNVGMNS